MSSAPSRERKARLLFVDDEQALLDGLRQSLHKERKRWEMEFAAGGEAGLAAAETGDFDVVISDIAMPKMSGTEFLQRFSELQPSSMRLVLSGHADPAEVLQALPMTHQWLAKPCPREELVHVLERALEAHALLHNPALQALVGDVRSIPPAPRIHQQLTSALVSGEAPMDDIADLVSQDPGMTAKFLQLVNSAFFALPRQVERVSEAIRFLGLQRVSQVVLASEVFQSLPGGDPATLQRVTDLAMASAHLAPRIAADLDLDPAIAGTAAVLQDAGILLVEHFRPAEAQAIRDRISQGEPRVEVERDALGATHEELGSALLACWGLPLPLITVVSRHHSRAEIIRNPLEMAGVLQITNCLLGKYMDLPVQATTPSMEELDEMLLDPTARNRFDDWRRVAMQHHSEEEAC